MARSPQKPGLVAKGMAPLNSIIGTMAINIVAKIMFSPNTVENKLFKNSVILFLLGLYPLLYLNKHSICTKSSFRHNNYGIII